MIGRRGFITGLLASAAMPMLIDGRRVVRIALPTTKMPPVSWRPFVEGEISAVLGPRNQYILVSRTFKELFDEQLARM